MLEFVPLTLSHKKQYEAFYTRTIEKSAQYSFFALWGWNESDAIELAWGDDICWISSKGHRDGLLAPIGDWENTDWRRAFDGLDDYLARHAAPKRLLDVPEALVKSLPENLRAFEITESRDEWEYIYSVSELIELKGGKYDGKRAHVKTFTENYKWEYRPLSPDDFEALLSFQSEWCRARDCGENPLLCAEDQAIRAALNLWDSLPMLGATIKVDGRVAAYTIAEELSRDVLDIRFEKADNNCQGIYQAINKFFLERQGKSYKWVNREEDMGNTGLRKAKKSYHPCGFLKKYKLEWK